MREAEREFTYMFFYEVKCRYCKKPFALQEGTKQYQQYKVNRAANFSCEDCDRCIEVDSRKYLFNRD